MTQTRDLRTGDSVLVFDSQHTPGALIRGILTTQAGVFWATVENVRPAPVGRGGASSLGRLVVETDAGDAIAESFAEWIVKD